MGVKVLENYTVVYDAFYQQIEATMGAADAQVFMQMMATAIAVAGVVALVFGILMIAATWRILSKAGRKGWKALIPVYSDYMLFKIAWKKKYFWLMILAGIASEAVRVAATYLPEYASLLAIAEWLLYIPVLVIALKGEFKLARAFRKGGGFAVGLILLPWIFYPILGFGKAKYRRRKKRRKALPAPEEA